VEDLMTHPKRRSTEDELLRWRRAGENSGAMTAVTLASAIGFIALIALSVLIQAPVSPGR
jgi:hypothetical protein